MQIERILMQIDMQQVQELKELHYLYVMEDNPGSLLLLNYTPRVTYDNVWDQYPLLAECRGMVVKRDGTVVGKPLRKFFEVDKHPSLMLADLQRLSGVPEISHKLDGSMIIAFFDQDVKRWHCTSRGSFISDVAIGAERFLYKHAKLSSMDHNLTYMFEYIGPENHIVVNYPEEALWLIGVIQTSDGYEYSSDVIQMESLYIHLPAVQFESVQDWCVLPQQVRDNFEGYVLWWPQHRIRAKIKLEAYRIAHRIATGISRHAIWEALTGYKYDPGHPGACSFTPQPHALKELRAQLDDDMWPWFDGVVKDLTREIEICTYDVQCTVTHLKEDYGTFRPGDRVQRKQVALSVYSNEALPAILRGWILSAYQGQDWITRPTGSLYRHIEPSGRSLFGSYGRNTE